VGLRIRTNIASLAAQRALNGSTAALRTSMEKLASGKRINKAADDAAGLAISENLRSQIVSLSQAKRNAADGVSIIQTAEGGLNESANILVRLRELAIQSASDTISHTERSYMQKEYGALRDEIDRIANSTEYNGTRLLVGNRENAPDDLDMSLQNEFPLSIHVGKGYYADLDAEGQRNPVNIIRLDLSNLDGYAAGLGLGKSGESDEIKIENRDGAQKSITRIDAALNKVNEYRSYLGATQNRIQSTIANLEVHIENMQSSRSLIQDTDFAHEAAELTQTNILQSAGASILSQANAQPNIVLSLLK
jgi:flagellin